MPPHKADCVSEPVQAIPEAFFRPFNHRTFSFREPLFRITGLTRNRSQCCRHDGGVRRLCQWGRVTNTQIMQWDGMSATNEMPWRGPGGPEDLGYWDMDSASRQRLQAEDWSHIVLVKSSCTGRVVGEVNPPLGFMRIFEV